MKWWKCTLHRPITRELRKTRFVFAKDECAAICSLNWFGGELSPEAREADPAEVPAVQRGLTEASLEELFKEVNKRGFKVVQS